MWSHQQHYWTGRDVKSNLPSKDCNYMFVSLYSNSNHAIEPSLLESEDNNKYKTHDKHVPRSECVRNESLHRFDPRLKLKHHNLILDSFHGMKNI